MPLSLPDAAARELAISLRATLRDDHDVEIGELGARLLLERIVAEVGPSLYNQALRDAQAHLGRIVDDLDVTLRQPGARG